MDVRNIERVERIARYLDVSPGKLEVSAENGVLAGKCERDSQVPIQGFATVVRELARASEYPDVLGSEKEVQASTNQWLEYATLCANYVDHPQCTKRILNELNAALKHATYIVGTEKTIADVTLYYILHSTMKSLSYPEKGRYVHVSRWFDNLQQDDRTRQELDSICFNLLHLFA